MPFFGKCDGWCAPTIIYLILAGISLVLQFVNYFVMSTEWSETVELRDRIMAFLYNVLMALIFTFILYVICTHCYPGVAWFLLLLPIIVLIVLMFMIASMKFN